MKRLMNLIFAGLILLQLFLVVPKLFTMAQALDEKVDHGIIDNTGNSGNNGVEFESPPAQGCLSYVEGNHFICGYANDFEYKISYMPFVYYDHKHNRYQEVIPWSDDNDIIFVKGCREGFKTELPCDQFLEVSYYQKRAYNTYKESDLDKPMLPHQGSYVRGYDGKYYLVKEVSLETVKRNDDRDALHYIMVLVEDDEFRQWYLTDKTLYQK